MHAWTHHENLLIVDQVCCRRARHLLVGACKKAAHCLMCASTHAMHFFTWQELAFLGSTTLGLGQYDTPHHLLKDDTLHSSALAGACIHIHTPTRSLVAPVLHTSALIVNTPSNRRIRPQQPRIPPLGPRLLPPRTWMHAWMHAASPPTDQTQRRGWMHGQSQTQTPRWMGGCSTISPTTRHLITHNRGRRSRARARRCGWGGTIGTRWPRT